MFGFVREYDYAYLEDGRSDVQNKWPTLSVLDAGAYTYVLPSVYMQEQQPVVYALFPFLSYPIPCTWYLVYAGQQ